MAYNIGQIRKGSFEDDILTRVTSNRIEYSSSLIEGDEEELSGSITNLLITGLGVNTYYLYGKIRRITKEDIPQASRDSFITTDNKLNNNTNLSYDVILGKYDGENFTKITQIRTNLLVNSIKNVEEDVLDINKYETVELVFNIENENINAVLFELDTIKLDYILEPSDNIRSGWLNNNSNFKFQIFTVNNLISQKTLSKIGVRTRPGQVIIINREPIRVGKSGLYEVYTGAKINFFSIVSASMVNTSGSSWNYDSTSVPNFILDYVIKKDTSTNTEGGE